MRWLNRLIFANQPPPAPVLLRVVEPGGSPSAVVRVDATWFPSGKTASRSHRTAAGLCVVPWVGEEESVELAVRTQAGVSQLSVSRDRLDAGRVHDLALHAEG